MQFNAVKLSSGKLDRDFWDVLLGMGEPFGARRRSLAAVTLVVGILTFFIPLVTTNPPVLNKTQWSVFDIVRHVWGKELPGTDWDDLVAVHLPFVCVLLYVFLLSTIVLMRSPELENKLPRIAVLGIWLDAAMWHGWHRWSFERTFYGHVSYENMSPVRHVAFGQLLLVQLAIWGALLFIAANEDLDAVSAAKGVPDVDPIKSIEPEFLEVEILPPEQTAKRPHRGAPRLHD